MLLDQSYSGKFDKKRELIKMMNLLEITIKVSTINHSREVLERNLLLVDCIYMCMGLSKHNVTHKMQYNCSVSKSTAIKMWTDSEVARQQKMQCSQATIMQRT